MDMDGRSPRSAARRLLVAFMALLLAGKFEAARLVVLFGNRADGAAARSGEVDFAARWQQHPPSRSRSPPPRRRPPPRNTASLPPLSKTPAPLPAYPANAPVYPQHLTPAYPPGQLDSPQDQPSFPPWPPFRPRAPHVDYPPGVAVDPVVAICSVWHEWHDNDTCADIANLYGLPSIAFLQRMNPLLDCGDVQPGSQLCAHRVQQWPMLGCARQHTLMDGQSCALVAALYPAWLPGGEEELYSLNPGLECNYLLRGMQLCVRGRGTRRRLQR